jgi:hypothetical protein
MEWWLNYLAQSSSLETTALQSNVVLSSNILAAVLYQINRLERNSSIFAESVFFIMSLY